MNFKTFLNKNIANILGWSTSRKIVVIESDDWGSIRMSSPDAYRSMIRLGYPLQSSHYSKFDALETNEDLTLLYEVLNRYRDKQGEAPVITAAFIVCNPNFEKIRDSGFNNYFNEPINKILGKYPVRDKVFNLYKVGVENRLFVPVFHGREHLNVQRWMRELQNGNQSVLKAFHYGVSGIDKGKDGEKLPVFQAAFDLDFPEDITYMQNVLEEGLTLFEELFGYKSEYFIPTNGPFNNCLESVLYKKGVRFINTAKKQIEPLGNNRHKTNIRFLGQKNNLGQRYITRNCFFEPSSMEYPSNKDWVNDCLQEMEIAFRWKKPAIISSHRVNYVGFLDPENRKRGLEQLGLLLNKMLMRWPDIEFMTSVELGNLMNAKIN